MSSAGHDRSISRRTVLRGAAAAAAFGAAAAAGWTIRRTNEPRPWDAAAFPPSDGAKVALLRAASYDADLEGIVFDGLREIEADVRGARVLLKPNLVEYDPGSAINTDPRLVAATAMAFRRLGAASVHVGEGPGHRRDTGYVMEASGLGDALRAAEIGFIDFNVAASHPVSLRSRYTRLGELWLPTAVTEADVVVSMPKMKTHHWAGITLSLKNCFGCLPGRVYGWPKNELHWQGIERSILDIAGAVRPTYAIVDGIVGMEGDGPINGTPKAAGLLVIADDPVAADATAAHVMGFDPESLTWLTEAGRFLGTADLERITVRGEDPSASVSRFQPAPTWVGAADTTER